MINIDEMTLQELLNYAYAAIHRIENAYARSDNKQEFKKIFNPKDLNKFIKNIQIILTKLKCSDLNEDIKISLNRYKESDIHIYEGLDYIIFNKYYDESKNICKKYDYDVSKLSLSTLI